VRIFYGLPNAGSTIDYRCTPTSFGISLGVYNLSSSYSYKCGFQTCNGHYLAQGKIIATAAGVNCEANCFYPGGTIVTLTATPLNQIDHFAGADQATSTLSNFDGWWSGACSGFVPTCTLTITGATIVQARFNPVTP
jgi:hypothetical protein